MAAAITKDQRDRAVAWLREHPDFATESSRLALRSSAFATLPGAEPLLDLDLSGDRDQVAERLVERLRNFGCLDGRHALGLLLGRIAEHIGDDRRPAVLALIRDLDLHCTQPAGDAACPYLGLDAFTEADAQWFCGREPFVETLVRAVDASPVVAVIGPSGSGKSSVVQAGLFADLERRGGWTRAILRPGHDPWSSLAGCLCDLLGLVFANDLERTRATKRLGAELAAATRARDPDQGLPSPADLIHRVLAKRPQPTRLLLLVDQWEELYTHRHDGRGNQAREAEAGADAGPAGSTPPEPLPEHFANALLDATEGAPVTLVLTLRADFYHRLLGHRRLADAVRGAGHVDLSPMNGDELLRAIVEPARRTGLVFEFGLPERILEDLGQEPGQLPLLELCLKRLWQRRRDGGLSAAAYAALGSGGVRGVILEAAEEQIRRIESAGPDRLDQVRDLFLRLVQLDDSAPDTRRRARRSDLGEAAWALAQPLAKARLLVTGRDPASGEQTLEVAHEALIRGWDRLREWLNEAREGLRLQAEVCRAARLWDDKGRAPDHHWPDSRVMEAAPVLRAIEPRFPLGERERAFLGPMEAAEMLARLDDPATPHAERARIGDRLCLLPGGDPRPGVGLGADGLPEILWCDIPGGEVQLSIDEAPGPRFKVEPFQLARYPITVAQWRAFLDDPAGYDALIRKQHKGVEPGVQRGGASHPAVNLAWFEAMAFCAWLTGRLAPGPDQVVRLPTEWEWQQAACSARADWAYPWGAEWAEGRANTSEGGLGRITSVRIYPAGRSQQGVLDLAGNVWEWCLNEHDKPERTGSGGAESRVVRGGSWNHGLGNARAGFRYRYHAGGRYGVLGFRVLLSSPIR